LAYTEEIFGPVMIVNTFKTEEALSEANMTEYGLFCKDDGPLSPYDLYTYAHLHNSLILPRLSQHLYIPATWNVPSVSPKTLKLAP
jgi:hypothetical protein